MNMFFMTLIILLVGGIVAENLYTKRFLSLKEKQMMSLTKNMVDQNNVILSLRQDLDSAVNGLSGVLDIVEKLSQRVGKDIASIDKDMENIIKMIKLLSKSQKQNIISHNELVNYTVEELSKVWCDLCENDCEECPFEENCKNWDCDDNELKLDDNDLPNIEDKSFIVEDYDNRGCTGSMTIDINNPEQFDQLFSKMKESGLPDVVINKYKETVERLLNNRPKRSGDKMDIIWNAQPINRFKPFLKDKNIKDDNKLIDPNSKIVKSLEDLFNKPE